MMNSRKLSLEAQVKQLMEQSREVEWLHFIRLLFLRNQPASLEVESGLAEPAPVTALTFPQAIPFQSELEILQMA